MSGTNTTNQLKDNPQARVIAGTAAPPDDVDPPRRDRLRLRKGPVPNPPATRGAYMPKRGGPKSTVRHGTTQSVDTESSANAQSEDEENMPDMPPTPLENAEAIEEAVAKAKKKVNKPSLRRQSFPWSTKVQLLDLVLLLPSLPGHVHKDFKSDTRPPSGFSLQLHVKQPLDTVLVVHDLLNPVVGSVAAMLDTVTLDLDQKGGHPDIDLGYRLNAKHSTMGLTKEIQSEKCVESYFQNAITRPMVAVLQRALVGRRRWTGNSWVTLDESSLRELQTSSAKTYEKVIPDGLISFYNPGNGALGEILLVVEIKTALLFGRDGDPGELGPVLSSGLPYKKRTAVKFNVPSNAEEGAKMDKASRIIEQVVEQMKATKINFAMASSGDGVVFFKLRIDKQEKQRQTSTLLMSRLYWVGEDPILLYATAFAMEALRIEGLPNAVKYDLQGARSHWPDLTNSKTTDKDILIWNKAGLVTASMTRGEPGQK